MGFQETVNPNSYSNTFSASAILENVLYNAGYIYSSIINIVLNDPTTVTNWPYYLAYQVGNIAIRFIYKASNINQDL